MSNEEVEHGTTGEGNETVVDADTREIYAALSNKDTMMIFNLASGGIDATQEVIQKYNLSKKRYYVRLGELVDLGLVFKDNGIYRHSALGEIVYNNQVQNLRQILLKKSSIEVLQDLKKQKSMGDDGKKYAVEEISDEVLKDLESTTGLANLKPIRLFRTWNDLSSFVALLVDSMKSELYSVTRYMDFRTAEAAIGAANRGCRINLLHSDRGGLSTKLQLIGNLMTHPKAAGVFKELSGNPNVNMSAARSVPYSFLVVDSMKVGIEIVDPTDPFSFFLGLSFESPSLASKLIEQYKKMEQQAVKEPISPMLNEEEKFSTGNVVA